MLVFFSSRRSLISLMAPTAGIGTRITCNIDEVIDIKGSGAVSCLT